MLEIDLTIPRITFLVMRGGCGAKVRNAPFHTNIPMRERPVGNHLGIFALPLEP